MLRVIVCGFVRLGLGLLRRILLLNWWRRRDGQLLAEETQSLTSLVLEFLSLHREWSMRMLELEQERLRLESLRLEGARPLSEVPMGQLRVSEDEQDADWALRTGLISPAEYNDLLEKAGLSPSDIEFV
jgi:hypothetical protein